MMRLLLIIVIVGLLGGTSFAEKRVALIIGNSHYEQAGVLQNPANDAADLSLALKRLGFDATELHNLEVRDFDRSVDAFVGAAQGADIALPFFAGHGLTIDGKGYLVPVDFRAYTLSGAFRELVPMTDLISRVEHAAKSSVLIFDACRDSPIAERFRRISVAQNRALPPKGLPPIPTSVLGSNTLVVFATAPGEIAKDGTGQRNSPFAAAY
jgi:uncharacterized caspase-like protein